ncbi:PAP [Mytilus edulis]|uniref:PAP n=1 Tax=Mytilus edulis TaxID=6550 RepID=A0A8S3T7A2_MYTED|nr:PAP [Mytilus edulis]
MFELEKANMEDANKISSIVSKTLYFTDQGISSKISNLHKNMIISQSTLFTAVHEKFKIHYGGSYAEGTYSPGSDIDRMMVIPNILVISNGNERNDRIGHIFQRNPRKCRAGFFMLVLQQLQRLENDLFLPYGKDINDMLEKDNAGNSFCLVIKCLTFQSLILRGSHLVLTSIPNMAQP